MVDWGPAIPDMVLTTLYIIFLLILATSSENYFKTPFYVFFISTGTYSVTAIISYYVFERFQFSEQWWTIYFYKPAYALNAIGAFGATMGKTNIVIHRYLVMKSRDFAETNWPRRVVFRILLVQFIILVLLTTSIWPATYIYANNETKDRIVGLSDLEVTIQIAIAVTIYVMYIVCSVVFTILTSRELIRIRGMLENSTDASKKIMTRQRTMIIIVGICSVTHLLKMIQQLILAFCLFFAWHDLYDAVYSKYPLFNGLASYAAPVCLIALSPTVRARILTVFKIRRARNITAVVTVTNQTM